MGTMTDSLSFLAKGAHPFLQIAEVDHVTVGTDAAADLKRDRVVVAVKPLSEALVRHEMRAREFVVGAANTHAKALPFGSAAFTI